MDWVGTLANWASIIGLIFSALAVFFSKRASKAAEEARDSVLLRSLSQEMNEGNRTAAEIARFVSMERGDMALLRTTDLLNATSYSMTRWGGRLTEQSRTNLVKAQRQLRSIHDVLTKNAISELHPSEKSQLARSCQRVSVIFSEEHGRAVRTADEVG